MSFGEIVSEFVVLFCVFVIYFVQDVLFCFVWGLLFYGVSSREGFKACCGFTSCDGVTYP